MKRVPKVKIVHDWRNGWRWLSVQLMAISAAIQFGAGSLPPWLHDAVPVGWWKYLSGGALVCAIVARFIRQNLEQETAPTQPDNGESAK